MNTTSTKFISLIAAVGAAIGMQAQSIDLVPGINYSYNPCNNDCHITGIQVDACNNDQDPASAFDVGMYLYDQGSGNYWVIDKYRLNAGLSGNACVTISNWDINIDNSGQTIQNGTYRLGIWVDASQEITETDENNNAGLLSGNNVYATCLNSIKINEADKYFSVFPVPAAGEIFIKWMSDKEAGVAEIYDIAGKVVKVISNEIIAGNHILRADVSDLENGIYFVKISTGNSSLSKRFVINR